jgi:hypothetical protein
MTPKEKAKELFMDMKYHIPYVHDPTEPSEDKIAKQCALIAINQIIESHYKLLSGVNPSVYNFWKEVKQEVKKL